MGRAPDLIVHWPAEWDGLSADRCLERADAILFLRRRSDELRDQGRADAADELGLMANMLSAGGHQGCYLQHSKPPPAGWEKLYPGPLPPERTGTEHGTGGSGSAQVES
jgi:hypothetical protein